LLVGLQFAIPRNAAILMIFGSILFVFIIGLFYYQMLNDRHFFLHIFRFLRLNRIKNKTLKNIELKIEKIELIMIEFYKHNKKAFVMSLFVTLLTWVAMFFEYKLATTMLGLDLGVVPLFFIITFIGLAVLFPIPMAVGVLEAGQVSAFEMINLSGGAGVALAFVVRMKDLFFGTIGMILLAMYGFDVPKTIKTKYNDKNIQKN
jgi:uncharacterized membrane protein YbhN (UPF0104 family)